MPSVDFDSKPADVRWPVTRGDDEDMPLQLFSEYYGVGDARNVPLDVTGRGYTGTVAPSRGGTATTTIDFEIVDALTGQITPRLADAKTDLLTNPVYVWDVVENAGTSEETTIIVGRMTVSGRATTP